MIAQHTRLNFLFAIAGIVAGLASAVHAGDEPDRTRRSMVKPAAQAPAAPSTPPPAQPATPQPPQAPAAAPPAPSAAAPNIPAVRARTLMRAGQPSSTPPSGTLTNVQLPKINDPLGRADRTRSGLVQGGRSRSGSRENRHEQWQPRERGDRWSSNNDRSRWQSRYDTRGNVFDQPRYVDLPSFSPDVGPGYTDTSGAGLFWTFRGDENLGSGVGVFASSPRVIAPSPAFAFHSRSSWQSNDWRWRSGFEHDRWRFYRGGSQTRWVYEDCWSRLQRPDVYVLPQPFVFITLQAIDDTDDSIDAFHELAATFPEASATEAERERWRAADALRSRINPRYNVVPDFKQSIAAAAQGEYSQAINALRRAAMINPDALLQNASPLARSLRADRELEQQARYALTIFRNPPAQVVSEVDARFMVAALSGALGDDATARVSILAAIDSGDRQASTRLLQSALDRADDPAPSPWVEGGALRK